MHVKKGDTVVVLNGDLDRCRGKTGVVVRAMPREQMVLVEGVNKRMTFKKKGASTSGKGEMVEREMPIHVSRVRLAVAADKRKKSGAAKPAKAKKV